MSASRRALPRFAISSRQRAAIAVVALAVGVRAGAPRLAGQDKPLQTASVDFIVVTPAGQPVTDLKADEITLRIDNRARPIRSLQFVRIASAAAARGQEGTPIQTVAPAFVTNLASATAASRSILVVVDDESMPIGEEQRLRSALNTFVGALPPADRVALVTVPHGGIKVGLTADRDRLRAGIAQISPIQSIMHPTCRTRDTLATLEATISQLTRASQQPVVVAFLSASLTGQSVAEEAQRPTGTNPGGVSAQAGSCYLPPGDFVRVGAAVAASRVQLYVIHPDFSQQPAKEGIENLRGQTGAPLFHLSAGTEPGLARVARETSAYYVATFDIEPNDRANVLHQASIRTTRPDVELRGRPYVTVGRAEPAPAAASSSATFTTAFDMVRSGRAFSDLPLRAAASSSRQPDGHVKVIGLFEPVDPSVKIMTAAAALFDENGLAMAYWQAEADKLTIWPTALGMVVPPGSYRLRIAAIDSTGRPGLVDDKIVAELRTAGALQMSDLVLGVTRDGTFTPRLQFSSETRATAYLELYGGSEGTQVAAVVEVSRTTDGPAMLQIRGDLAATSDEGRFAVTATIPVGALAPGDYVIRAIAGVVGQPQGRVLRTLHKAGFPGSRP